VADDPKDVQVHPYIVHCHRPIVKYLGELTQDDKVGFCFSSKDTLLFGNHIVILRKRSSDVCFYKCRLLPTKAAELFP